MSSVLFYSDRVAFVFLIINNIGWYYGKTTPLNAAILNSFMDVYWEQLILTNSVIQLDWLKINNIITELKRKTLAKQAQ